MTDPPALSPEARKALLALARATLEAHFAGRPPAPLPPFEELRQPGSAFVTLRRRSDHELRGCVGFMDSGESLAEVAAEAAVAAAVRDGRFDVVTAAEVPALRIEISVLTMLQPIESDQVEVGRHGLVVQYAGKRGLLLPQVPVDRGWDCETFLSWTCRKAGLPPDTWKRPGCELLGFTAQVFAED
jgi:AmmeMemoRadiSam system protein A